jgi:hypothetical protein
VTHHARVALVLFALLFAGAAQMMSAEAMASLDEQGGNESSLTVLTHRQDSAIVPASALVRAGRTIGELSSVTLAGLLALVALLALWFTASVRRRERLASAVLTYRRRGPPALLPLN